MLVDYEILTSVRVNSRGSFTSTFSVEHSLTIYGENMTFPMLPTIMAEKPESRFCDLPKVKSNMSEIQEIFRFKHRFLMNLTTTRSLGVL